MAVYKAYKDSKTPWMGMIPTNWGVIKVKLLCDSIFAGATPSTNVEEYWGGDLPWIPSGCCHDCQIDEAPKFITAAGVENSSTKLIPAGSTVMAMTGATCAQLGYVTFDTYANQSVVAYIVKPQKLVSKYLFYALYAAREYILSFQTGGAQAGINVEDCSNLVIPLVDVSEQKRIVSFLDSKYETLNNLISEKQTLVDSLKNYRDSVITELVTKGYDPNITMRDSGVDWIGQIPQDWLVYKVNWAFKTIGSGTTPDTNNRDFYTSKDGINWLQTGDLNDGTIKETSKLITKEALKKCHLQVYPKGSIVVAMYGATIGKVGILDIDCATNQACCVMTDSDILDKDYAYYIFLASKQSLVNKSNGGGQPNISQAIIRNHRIPVPPIETQKQIVREIRNKLGSVEDILKLQEEQVTLIKNYRDALIYEAVTGKFVCSD